MYLLLLRGYFRYLDSGSTIGVHRFSKTTTSSSDLDMAQIVAGQIIAYFAEMGVDGALFELMSRAGNTEISISPVVIW